MTDSQLPVIIPPPGALTTPADAPVVPALIASCGDQAICRYVEFFAANIRNPNTRRAYVRACSRFFAWCERTRARARQHPAVRCRGVDRAIAADAQRAGREAAARGGAHAVRLARRRPDRADEPGRRGARPEACRENRQDAGA
jgi:hypothetical protein